MSFTRCDVSRYAKCIAIETVLFFLFFLPPPAHTGLRRFLIITTVAGAKGPRAVLAARIILLLVPYKRNSRIFFIIFFLFNKKPIAFRSTRFYRLLKNKPAIYIDKYIMLSMTIFEKKSRIYYRTECEIRTVLEKKHLN